MIHRSSIGVGLSFGSSRFNGIINQLGCSGGMAMGLGGIWVAGCGLGVLWVLWLRFLLGWGAVVARWWVVVAWILWVDLGRLEGARAPPNL